MAGEEKNKPEQPTLGALDISGLEQAAPMVTAKAIPIVKITAEAMGLGKKKFKLPKYAIYIGIAVGALIIISLGVLIYYLKYVPKPVTIVPSPADAKISIEWTEPAARGAAAQEVRKILQAPGLTIKLKPSKPLIGLFSRAPKEQYTLKAAAENYVPRTLKFDVGAMGETVKIELAATPDIAKVSDELVSFPALTPEGASFYYLTKAGDQIKKLDVKTGRTTVLTQEALTEIQGLVWPPSRELVIARVKNNRGALQEAGSPLVAPEVPDYITVNWVYNFARTDLIDQTYKQLNSYMKDVSFSAYGDKLIYVFGGATASLNISDLDGSNWSPLVSLNSILQASKVTSDDLAINVSPDGKKVAISSTNETKQVGIWIYDLITKDLTQLGDSLSARAPKFSYYGKRLIYLDKSTAGKNTIWVANTDATAAADLKIATLPEKMVWGADDDTFYYAISVDQTGDKFFKYSLVDKKSTPLAYTKPATPLNITSMMFPVVVSSVKTGDEEAVPAEDTTNTESLAPEKSAQIAQAPSKTTTTNTPAVTEPKAETPTTALPPIAKVTTNVLFFVSDGKLYKLEVREMPEGYEFFTQETPAEPALPASAAEPALPAETTEQAPAEEVPIE